jgi:AraC-like DNA-binding protein
MLGKMRQSVPEKDKPTGKESKYPRIEEIFDARAGKARGALKQELPTGGFRHVRRGPSLDLEPWIAHYWIVSWDLSGHPPQRVETLPHPNVHLVFEDSAATVSGVQTGKFTRMLEGRSQIFGVKFKAGGFRPFMDAAVATLLNQTIPARQVFGDAIDSLLSAVHSEEEKIEAANAFFHARMPQPDASATMAGQLVDRILQDREIRTVDDLVRQAAIGKRSLQRLFYEYVGVAPKWVIRRYRLHELVERINAGGTIDWPQLALELGYFDQAHLINDFRYIVGDTPTQYQSRI